MTTKYYTNREELYKDMEFIYDLRIPYDVKQTLLDELFESWKNNSPDSPWCKHNDPVIGKEEYSAANTLISISRGEGISSEWKGEHIVFENVNGKNKRSNRKINKKHNYNLRSR